MRKFISLTIIIPLIITLSHAKPSSPVVPNWYSYDGKTIGARAIGMGGAFVAQTDDMDSSYYNPAGLFFVMNNKATFMFDVDRQYDCDLSAVDKYDSLGSKKLLYFSLCGPMGSLSYRPIAKYEKINSQGQTVNLRVSKYSLSVAVQSEDRTEIMSGISINYFSGFLGYMDPNNDVIKLTSGSGVGIDWGFLYELSMTTRLGFMLENAPAAMFWSEYERDIIPFRFRMGLGMDIGKTLKYAFDYNRSYYRGRDDLILYHTGIEETLIDKKLVLRAGIYGENLDVAKELSYGTGIGYKLEKTTLDLGFNTYRLKEEAPDTLVTDIVLSMTFDF